MDRKELVFDIASTLKAVLGDDLPILTALWTEACLAFPAIDALREGYEVHVVADAVGGTLVSKTQLYCELQRDWAREKTVPGFMRVFQNADGPNPERDFKG